MRTPLIATLLLPLALAMAVPAAARADDASTPLPA